MRKALRAVCFLAAWATLSFTPAAARATEDLAFSPVQSERELNFIAVALGLKDRIAALRASGGSAILIEYAMIDLDADGEGEIFVRLSSGPDCMPGSCRTLVFNNADDRWAKVLETDEPDVTVAKQTHRGYRDVLVGSTPWLWTGKEYAPGR